MAEATILHWNVYGASREAVRAHLREIPADIICLQGLKGGLESNPEDDPFSLWAKEAGHTILRGNREPLPAGLVTLSRCALKKTITMESKGEDESEGLIGSKAKYCQLTVHEVQGGQQLYVANADLTPSIPGLDIGQHLTEADGVLRVADILKGEPLVVGGSFHRKPNSHFIQKLGGVLRSASNQREPTYAIADLGIVEDYVFVNEHVQGNTMGLGRGPSAHTPLLTLVKFSGANVPPRKNL